MADIVTTNRNLEEEVARENFREDLYYRLNVLRIHLPPLRERKEDIPALAQHFLRIHNDENGFSAEGFDKACIDMSSWRISGPAISANSKTRLSGRWSLPAPVRYGQRSFRFVARQALPAMTIPALKPA